NILAATSMPRIFVCPSTKRGKYGNESNMKDYALVYDSRPGPTSPNENCCPERASVGGSGPFNGMGWVNSSVKIRDVTDGTSNTLLVVEKVNSANQSWCSEGLGCNQFFWVHHQSQGMVTCTYLPNDTRSNSRAPVGTHIGKLMVSFVDGHVSAIDNG